MGLFDFFKKKEKISDLHKAEGEYEAPLSRNIRLSDLFVNSFSDEYYDAATHEIVLRDCTSPNDIPKYIRKAVPQEVESKQALIRFLLQQNKFYSQRRTLFVYDGKIKDNESVLPENVRIDCEKNTFQLDITTGKIYINKWQGFMGYGADGREAQTAEKTYECSVQAFHRHLREYAPKDIQKKYAGYSETNWIDYI